MVDIKTLRIGAHISIGGKRVRVCGITKRKIGYHHPDDRNNAHLRYARINDVESISLTSELLTELGFEKGSNVDIIKRTFNYIWARKDEDSDVCWLCGEKDNFFILQSGVFGQLNVKYLHEAEAFLALCGVDLIQD